MENKRYDYDNLKLHYQKCVLDSGLTVIYYEKKGFNRFLIDVGVNYGANANAFYSDNKRYEITKGVAHYLEHKMFTLQDGSDAAMAFDHMSLANNAMTSYNTTQYYCSGVRHFTEGLTFLLKMVLQMPLLTESTYLKELPIITEEIDMYRNMVEAELENGLNQRLFNDYYLAMDVAGTSETIRDITPVELQHIFKTMYIPANMVLIIVGDLAKIYDKSWAELCDNINLLTLPYKKEKNFSLDYGYNPLDSGQGPQIEYMNVGLDYSSLGFKKDITSLSLMERDHLFDVVNVIMQYYGGENSPFMDKLRQRGVIYNSDYSIDVNEHFLVVTLKAMGEEMDTFDHEASELLSQIAEKPLNKTLLEPTIHEIMGERINDLEDDEIIVDILMDETFGNTMGFKDYLFIQNMTEEDIQKGLSYFKDMTLEYFRIMEKPE